MSNIQVGGALLPGSVDTPLDARSRIAALENIPDIPNPFIGMTFYVTATGKQYIVKSLKSKQIGAATVANAAIDQYEIAGGADTDQLDVRYAAKDHDHNNAYAAKAHNHDAEYAAKTHGHAVADVTGLQDALDGTAQRPKKLTLIKPANAKAVWPVVEAFPDQTFTESAKVAVCGKAEHLDRVAAWSGTAWNTLTSEGLTDTYKNLPVEIDVSSLELTEGYFRYYWIDADGNTSDVLSLPFPAITEPTPFHLQAITAPDPGYKIRPLTEAEYYALDEADPLTFYFVAGVGIVFGGVQYSSAPAGSAE